MPETGVTWARRNVWRSWIRNCVAPPQGLNPLFFLKKYSGWAGRVFAAKIDRRGVADAVHQAGQLKAIKNR